MSRIMHSTKEIRTIYTVLAIVFSSSAKPFHTEFEYFIIRNTASGHVLDASTDFVKLERFTGFSSQQWRLEPARGGQHYIINKGTEKVMDLDYSSPLNKTQIVVREKSGSGTTCLTKENSVGVGACQKWYIHYGGFIVNVCGKYGLDVQGGFNFPGDSLQTFPLHEKENQQFMFQYV